MRISDRRVAWLVLVLAAVAVALGLSRLGVPGAWLLGPMLVGIVYGVSVQPSLTPPRWFATAAQIAIGCMVARTFEPAILIAVAHDWPIMIGVVVKTVLASALVGYVITRLRVLPEATAAWGSAPGAASAMVLMSEEFGADPRLVAFMQYLRVALVVASTSLVTRAFFTGAHAASVNVPIEHFDAIGLGETVLVAAIGYAIARVIRLPSGALLGPLVLGATLHATGIVHLEVPTLAIEAAYSALGLYIGLRYTPETVRYALRALPTLLVSVVALIALCGLVAAGLTRYAHVDGLTAYLATSPGGLDAVALIAIGSGANVSLVVSLQILRVFVVILTGPAIARAISRSVKISSPSDSLAVFTEV